MHQRQFTLRKMFLVMGVLAVPFAGIGYLVRIQQLDAEGERAVLRATAKIEKLGGHIDKGNVNGTYYIWLDNTQLTDADLADLAADMRAFRPGWIDQDHDVDLRLSGTRITDAGIESLAGVRLRGLSLPPQITDAAVPTLKRLRAGELDIHGTQITPQGLADLDTVYEPNRIRSNHRRHPYD